MTPDYPGSLGRAHRALQVARAGEDTPANRRVVTRAMVYLDHLRDLERARQVLVDARQARARQDSTANRQAVAQAMVRLDELLDSLPRTPGRAAGSNPARPVSS